MRSPSNSLNAVACACHVMQFVVQTYLLVNSFPAKFRVHTFNRRASSCDLLLRHVGYTGHTKGDVLRPTERNLLLLL